MTDSFLPLSGKAQLATLAARLRMGWETPGWERSHPAVTKKAPVAGEGYGG